ncbi:MAG TPA: hypothetical protein VKZ63_08810, partial [Kofleriaceae bacterium]|nr:hypothetical protein [Kofleriaceae bacterium]
MRRAAIELALSSGFAALAAVLAGGTVEMVRDASGPLGGVAAIGFLAVLAVPLGFTASVAGRLLVRGWRPGDLVGRLRDPATGGAPRLAAWALYLLAAAVALAAIVLQGMNAVTGRSSARIVHVLAAPMLAVGGAAALASVARPAVGGLTRLLTSADRAVHRRAGRS